jgi:hypothetical protein
MSVDELKAEVLRLDPQTRAYLARELLASLDTLTEAEIERLWMDEAVRRDEELDSGAAHAHPADEVLDRARTSRRSVGFPE